MEDVNGGELFVFYLDIAIFKFNSESVILDVKLR